MINEYQLGSVFFSFSFLRFPFLLVLVLRCRLRPLLFWSDGAVKGKQISGDLYGSLGCHLSSYLKEK